jgi:DNA-directed RNA polymerase specialized sigma24 family protein
MTKQELKEYYWIRRNITKLESRLIQLDSESTKVTTNLKKKHDAIVGKGNTSDKVGNSVTDMDEAREKLAEQIVASYAVLADIERAIEVLPARECYLVRARYIELLSWEQIAVDMGYSWQWVHKIHSGALAMLA